MGCGANGERPALSEETTLAYAPSRLVDVLADRRVRSWPKPLNEGAEDLGERAKRDEATAVIATGDPMHYGIGGTLARRLGADAVRATPTPSAFSLAASRLGWPLEDCACLSLHGTTGERRVNALERAVSPYARLILLCENGSTPVRVAKWLAGHGFGASRLHALEEMGGDGERRRTWAANEDSPLDISDLCTLAVECIPTQHADWNSAVPGLPDDAFVHDGQITKCELRAVTLAALKPHRGGVLWDVGAGCGSISIEWLRSSPGGRAFAVEPKPDRLAMIEENHERFAVAGLEIIPGLAPDALDGLDQPDAVFVGGGIATPRVANRAYEALRPGGRFVANAVTLEGEAALLDLRERLGGSLRRIAISHAEPIGRFYGWRPAMPVTMLSIAKRS